MSNGNVVIVVPTYCERPNIEPFLSRVHQALPMGRVVVVDDASPDGTGERVRELATERPWLSLLERPSKDGLGRAYVAGFEHVLAHFPDAEFFFQMDADLSHDPAYLPGMLQAAREADLVVASRYVHGISIVNWPLSRLIVSKLGTAYARVVTGLPITDCTGGFKCYRRKVLHSINLGSLRANGYVFQVETSYRAWRAGFRIVDFPIVFYERQHGESKLHLGIAFEAFRVTLGLGLDRLLHMRRRRRGSIPAIRQSATPASQPASRLESD